MEDSEIVDGDPSTIEADGEASIAVLGLPFDANSSFLRGAAKGPQAIREAFYSPSANTCSESGFDLGTDRRWRWEAELDLTVEESALSDIEEAVGKHLASGQRLVCLGGDHSVAWPILRTHGRLHTGLNVLQIDAHPDLYDELDGSRQSHACPFARVMEEGLVKRLVQVGIRTLNPHQREQAERFGVEVIEMRHWRPDLRLSFDGPLYLSLDLDALDPAFAPGVSHHEPGGFSTREVLALLQNIEGDLIGADIVELNPERDLNGVTAMVAAKFLKEILGRLLAGPNAAHSSSG